MPIQYERCSIVRGGGQGMGPARRAMTVIVIDYGCCRLIEMSKVEVEYSMCT